MWMTSALMVPWFQQQHVYESIKLVQKVLTRLCGPTWYKQRINKLGCSAEKLCRSYVHNDMNFHAFFHSFSYIKMVIKMPNQTKVFKLPNINYVKLTTYCVWYHISTKDLKTACWLEAFEVWFISNRPSLVEWTPGRHKVKLTNLQTLKHFYSHSLCNGH